MGAGETCCIFLLKNPKWYNGYFMATTKWVTCLSLSIKFLMDTCPCIKKKKSQLALIGILACIFCREFSNRHGSRTPSISPQERSPQQTKRLLVLALGSFVTIKGSCAGSWLYGLALGSHENEKPLCCWLFTGWCVQLALESWGHLGTLLEAWHAA